MHKCNDCVHVRVHGERIGADNAQKVEVMHTGVDRL